MDDQLYNYKAELVRVIDGDTVVVDLDLGLTVKFSKFKIRLARINAPEVRGESKPEGEKATKYLKRVIGRKEIIVQTLSDKKDKYGRYLGEIFVKTNKGWININDKMLDNNHAVAYRGSIDSEFIY